MIPAITTDAEIIAAGASHSGGPAVLLTDFLRPARFFTPWVERLVAPAIEESTEATGGGTVPNLVG